MSSRVSTEPDKSGAIHDVARIVQMLVIVVFVAAITAVATSMYHSFATVTLLSLSPDDNWRVHLVELGQPINIDRNFRIRLEHLSDHSIVDLFQSPDEGRPIGSERILWAPDSRQFVLLGRHFVVREDAQLPTGESLYLLYDIPSGKLACNARQQSTYEEFTISDCPWLSAQP